MVILAIDFGMKILGFALGNTDTMTPVPLDPLVRKNLKEDLVHIKDLVREYEIDKLVIGYPVNMDGSQNKMTLRVEQFASYLGKNLKLEVEFIDERLSSFEAEETLKPLYRNYKKRKKRLDSISALIILNSYWERL